MIRNSQVGEQQTGEVGVKSLISRNELVRKGETGHKTSLLEPEDGCLRNSRGR